MSEQLRIQLHLPADITEPWPRHLDTNLDTNLDTDLDSLDTPRQLKSLTTCVSHVKLDTGSTHLETLDTSTGLDRPRQTLDSRQRSLELDSHTPTDFIM